MVVIAVVFTVLTICLARSLFPAAGSRRAIERSYRRNRADLSAMRTDKRNWVGQARKDFE